MSNYFTDTPALRHHLHHPLMERIVELKERGYADRASFDYAPVDYADAMDSYERVLELVGGLCADIIAPNAADVDAEGASVHDGHVTYARGTQENLEAVRKAGLMGIALPRRYGGLNFPVVPYIMAADMVARADAGFENLWGLQDCAETLYRFGNEDQRSRFIPRVCAGETMSMDLTEPDAGSDLQSVMLRATYSEKDNCWYLNGVKRFITNGDSDIHLVLARSEEGTRDGRGLSMFIYDKRDGGVTVRRIENKLGIKGSPTCELVYRNARAELCGERRLGLIKYVMSLMNNARLGIMAQAVGICEAAYREGYAYAKSRRQFGKAIIEFPAIYEMVSLMRARTDASRSMLYETARFVDMSKCLEELSKERKLDPAEREELKKYTRLADAFTPLGKAMTTEFANRNTYDAIQIHGGSGFMKDYPCERLYRDARITNIYEGTTQLQVVAALRHVTTGTYLTQIREYESLPCRKEFTSVRDSLLEMSHIYDILSDVVTCRKNTEYLDFHARRLVELAGHCILGHLLLQDAHRDELYYTSAQTYALYARAEAEQIKEFITRFNMDALCLLHEPLY